MLFFCHIRSHGIAGHGIGPGDTVGVMDWDSHRYPEVYTGGDERSEYKEAATSAGFWMYFGTGVILYAHRHISRKHPELFTFPVFSGILSAYHRPLKINGCFGTKQVPIAIPVV
jgi:hypothetical protein